MLKPHFIGFSLILCLASAHANALPRISQPLEIQAQELTSLEGTPITHINVLKLTAQQTWQAIPFQIDEQFMDDSVNQPRPILENDPRSPKADQKFNGHDALLWMNHDMGAQYNASTPLPSGSKSIYQIQAHDPNRKGNAWIYITTQSAFAKATQLYVKTNTTFSRIISRFFRIDFQSDAHAMPSQIRLNKRDKSTIDLLGRSNAKLILDFKVPFMVFDMDINNISSRLIGGKAGLIRAIRRVGSTVKVGFMKFTPKATTDFYFYQNHVALRSAFSNPISPGILSKPSRAYTIFEFDRKATQSAAIINKPNISSQEALKNYGDLGSWWAVLDKQWGFFSYARMLDKPKPHSDFRFHFKDDNPERREVGYFFDVKRFPRGTYNFIVRQYAGSFLNTQSVAQLLKDLEQPVVLSTQNIPIDA